MAKKSFNLEDIHKAVKEYRFEDGLRLIKNNLSSKPDHMDSLYLAAVCSRYLKRYTDAESYLKKLLSIAPDMGRAYQELAHLNRDKGNKVQSIGYYRQATEHNPALLASWNELHKFSLESNNRLSAKHALEKIEHLKSLPNILLHINQIFNEGNIKEAEKKCREFLIVNPTNTHAMSILSDIASRLGHLNDAEFLLESAVKLSPNDSEIRKKYLLILRKRQKFTKTMEQADILIEQFPDNLSFQAQKAIEVMQNGDHEESIRLLDKILKKAPLDPNTLTAKGHAEKTLGKTNDAIHSYQSAYNSKHDHGEAYFSLANLKTYKFDDEEIQQMKNQLKRVDISISDRTYFHFALAQACEAIEDFDEAFTQLDSGNHIRKQQTKYSIDRMNQEIQAQIDVCDKEFFDQMGSGGINTNEPIFILGLPRAGSTLIEQILASHSMIDGTLELPNILTMAQDLRGEDIYGTLGKYPGSMKNLSCDERKEMGNRFITDTKMHRDNAPMFTDKMPNNFRHIALIHLIMPNAKIIDARRYPLDCCFSMFKQLFAQGQEFTYGLKEAGSYYNSYVKLMNHWDNVLPGKILTVNNEDVIDDLEGQVRRLLNFLEIPFEQNCISFHETDRSVRTASSEQVRQPINKKGQGRWKPYAEHLKPLMNSLDKNLLHQQDIDLINK
ncbi:sulfotransferase [Gammaproteobacteria bacterium]|nr:sulfotransferase [Gammaproteobacteria bacterium]|tara:strand:- start:823 stop:2826 length:2004 start_codon:yes stop_codon:yes gene_type:complete